MIKNTTTTITPKHDFIDLIYKRIITGVILFISIFFIYGWLTNNESIIQISGKHSTLKFNTAIIILLSSIALILLKKQSKALNYILYCICFLLIFIGFISFLQHLNINIINLDNIFVYDSFSKDFPGRIAPATAVCSILLGIGILGFHSDDTNISRIGRYSSKIIAALAIFSIALNLGELSVENKTIWFKSMSLTASVSFLIVSLFLIIDDNESFLNEMFRENLEGSKLFRNLFPKIIFFPIIISNIILLLVNYESISEVFDIVLFTVILVLTSYVFIVDLAVKTNKTDKERTELEKLSLHLGEELSYFKETINRIAIIVKVNKEGLINFTNYHFYETSQFSKKDIYGTKYFLFDDKETSNNRLNEIKESVKNNSIWTGYLECKKKDNTLYHTKANVSGILNQNKEIVEYTIIEFPFDKDTICSK